jgi:preprotein translocase subunit SecA
VIDTLWQEHLSSMEYMRDSVKLRAYGGRDPLIEYKNEGRRMFSQLLEQMDATIIDNILRAGLVKETPVAPKVVSGGEDMGRNDLCFCGSGKKYKKCHGK